MKVTFYRMKSDADRVRKNISAVTTVDCWFKDNTSMLRPTIKIERSALPVFKDVNYFYIDTFNRYYDIAGDVLMVGDFLEVSGTVDALMSNANSIYGLTCYVLRQENAKNLYYNDNELAVKQSKSFTYKMIGTLPSVRTNILTVDGGK